MICALCLKPRELRKSHIISEFLYTTMYDDKHRFHQMEVGAKDSTFVQKGLRESLLCDDCEGAFSKFEKYGRSVLLGGVKLEFTQDKGITWIGGVDYMPFKLFQLSILWRAGVAKQDFFGNVTLGSHQEFIRQMLLHGDPGEPDRYGCLVRGLKLNGQVADVVIQPTKVRIAGAVGFRFVFGGCAWAYLVASHTPSAMLKKAFLQRDGRMAFSVGDLEDAPFFVNLIARLRGET